MVGTVAAFLTRLWVVFVTGCLMHSKREKVYQEVYEAVAAKRTVCLNQIRYYLGMVIVLITLSKCYRIISLFSHLHRTDLRLRRKIHASHFQLLDVELPLRCRVRPDDRRWCVHRDGYHAHYDGGSSPGRMREVPQLLAQHGPRDCQGSL